MLTESAVGEMDGERMLLDIVATKVWAKGKEKNVQQNDNGNDDDGGDDSDVSEKAHRRQT